MARKINSLDAFDSIEVPLVEKKKKSTKIAASVSMNVMQAVDEVAKLKAKMEQVKSDLAIQEGIVIDAVRPQQDSKARAGEFSKSFYVAGVETALTYTTADSFSVPQEASVLEVVKELVGDELYAAWFTKHKTIKLKDSVVADDEKIGKIIEAMNKSGLSVADFFEVTTVMDHCDDLDRKQYDLDDSKLKQFRTLVVPRKVALKPINRAE